MANFNNLSRESEEAIAISRKIAIKLRHKEITTTHVLMALLKQTESVVVDIMDHLNIDCDDLYNQFEKMMIHKNSDIASEDDILLFVPEIAETLKRAEMEMHKYSWDSIETIHIFLGILRNEHAEACQFLHTIDVTYEKVKQAIEEIINDKLSKNPELENLKRVFGESNNPFVKNMRDETHTTTKTRSKNRTTKNNTPALNSFGVNLTEKALQGKLDDVVGRDNEVKRMWQILNRRKKNNVALIGASGCGKTSMAEALANCIANKTAPTKMLGKQIWRLDVSGMVAGSKYRGEFEKKMKSVIEECIEQKNIILFIDEIHTIIGSGNSEGSTDGANILKPYLSSGEVQVIGATTTEEYQKHFEKDLALVRRFQKVVINPPNKQHTIQILKGIKKHYETYHNVTYSEQILELIVDLGEKYLSNSVEPDKSINTLDEVGSKLSLIETNYPKEYMDLRQKIDRLEEEKEKCVVKQDYEAAAILKQELTEKLQQLDDINQTFLSKNTKQVTEEDVREVFSLISNIPVESVQSKSNDAKRYLNMKNHLQQIIVNQDEAVEKISNIIKRKKSGVSDTSKPPVLLFAGPTGVGKTYLTKKLTEFLFGDQSKLVFLNGAEYADKTAVNRLSSANPGYVGYGEASDFEPIRNNPYSVLLIDECEKMHPDIWQIFLRIFEEGELKTSNGKLINFKNCIIILTSNIGSVASKKKTMGFKVNDEQNVRKTRYEEAIKQYFKPEVYNRISNIVVFNDLSREDLLNIVDLELNVLRNRLKEQNINLIVHKKAHVYLIDNSDDKTGELGARPIKRSIENHLNDMLADIILEKGDEIKSITISTDKNGLTFTTK